MVGCSRCASTAPHRGQPVARERQMSVPCNTDFGERYSRGRRRTADRARYRKRQAERRNDAGGLSNEIGRGDVNGCRNCQHEEPATVRLLRCRHHSGRSQPELASSGNVRLRAHGSLSSPADSLREKRERRLVSLDFASWNRISVFLARLDGVRRAA